MNAETLFEAPTEAPVEASVEEPADSSTEVATAVPEPPKPKPTVPKSKISNNAPGYRYKYPEAAPTPPGVDDDRWNKIYVAADSRFYNRAKKNASESRKIRLTGETYKLALQILKERDEKEAEEAANMAAGIVPAPKRAPKPKAPLRLPKASSMSSRDNTPSFNDRVPLSISEQIKSEGRSRKAMTSSSHGSPGPSAHKFSSPAPPQVKSEKPEKPLAKKKSTAPTIKKARPKGAKPEGNIIYNSSTDASTFTD